MACFAVGPWGAVPAFEKKKWAWVTVSWSAAWTLRYSRMEAGKG